MIAVTGGAGFIGSNIVKALNDMGEDNILIVDNLDNPAKHLNMNKLKFNDFIDKRDFLSVMKADKFFIKAFFHEGACSNTMETDGRYMMQNNYEFSKELLHYSIEKGTKFIYASSASVYGNGDEGFIESPECEYPLNVYAFSKFAFDNYVRRVKNPGIQIAGLRYFNVYGPQENHKGKMASVAFHFFNQHQDGSRVKLFEGSENFRRDFIHVDDVVAVNMFLYENPDVSGIFNCGTGNARSFADIAEVFRKRYGSEFESEIIPFPEQLKGKYQKYTQADLTSLRKAGYSKDFLSLEEGVDRYLSVLEKTGGYIK
ncbi:ADP-glyceromanno-heptose 6-epimerase [Geovibrio sp. ADMFC3]